MEKKTYRLVFSGGGSGGHLTPSMEIAREFLKENKNSKCLFIWSKKILDKEIIEKNWYNFKSIHSWKLRRYFSWQNFTDFFKFIYWIFESIIILRKFKADLVFSKWWFVSLPVAIAAYLLRIKIVAHESDTVPWLANKIISKFAVKICSTFPEIDIKYKEKIVITWTPIRKEITSSNKEESRKYLWIDDSKLLILFMWASQWADQINKICKNIFWNIKHISNIIVITWKKKKVWINDPSFKEFEFLWNDFHHVLSSADIVVSRAWANSLFELSALSKASIIIPLASSANNHQRKNAEFFENNEAIINIDPTLSEFDLSKKVLEKIIELWRDSLEKRQIEMNIWRLFYKDSVKKIIKTIQENL